MALFWIVATILVFSAAWLIIRWLDRHDRRIAVELAKLLQMPRKEKRAFVNRLVRAGCRKVTIYFLKRGGIEELDLESFLHLLQIKDPVYHPSFFVAQVVLEGQQRGDTRYTGHSIYYLGHADLSIRWHLEWDTIDFLTSSNKIVLLDDGVDKIEIYPDSQIIEEILEFCFDYSSVTDYRMKYFATWAEKKLEKTKSAFKSADVETVRIGLGELTSFPLNLPVSCQPDLDEVFKA